MTTNLPEYAGATEGIVIFEGGEFKIDTGDHEPITIGKGYDVYSNTIRKI